MALVTGANFTVDNVWREIASAAPQVLIQLLDNYPVVIAFGSAAPAAASTDGHPITFSPGRDVFAAGGLTTEKVYARTQRPGETVSVAVSKG